MDEQIYEIFKQKGKVWYGEICQILESLIESQPTEVQKEVTFKPIEGMSENDHLDIEAFKNLMKENVQIFEILKT